MGAQLDPNILICLQCDRRQKNCQGPCACTVDGRDIAQHYGTGQCPLGKFVKPQASIAGQVAHGAAGLAKAALRINRADDATIARRLATCGACPEVTVTLGIRRCTVCKCVLAAKAANADENCPLAKWEPTAESKVGEAAKRSENRP
ncbi:MAG: hypothetical protein JWN24_3213 [Phycisphaerales bacterium]|nr:hypothetical protein [Phycisphaerales bacterium]